MTKRLLIFYVLVVSAIYMGALAGKPSAGQAPQPQPMLDTPLAQLSDAAVACSASTPTLLIPAGTQVDSFYVANSSATCVHIGGPTVSTRGVIIGLGCRDGNGINFDARRGWCLSESGTVTVDTVYGAR